MFPGSDNWSKVRTICIYSPWESATTFLGSDALREFPCYLRSPFPCCLRSPIKELLQQHSSKPTNFMATPPTQTEGADHFVHLKVKTQMKDEGALTFKLRRTAKLEKLMKAYCDQKKVDCNSYRFIFNGGFIKGHQTPEELEMEDEDEIDAVLEMTGGLLNGKEEFEIVCMAPQV